MSVFQQYALWVQIARKAPYIKMDSQQASRHKDKEESNLKSVKILNDDLIADIERDIVYDR